MKKIAIWTTFYEVDSGYSLIAVVENQIKMLLDHGYSPVVLVRENFKTTKDFWQPYNIDVRPVLPDLDSKDILPVLREHLDKVDICLTHDIILLDTYREYNKAMREYSSERNDLLWLHWIHSCPSDHEETPPGYIIYPNSLDKPRVCQVYDLMGEEWKVIPNRASHSIDPLLVWNYSPLTLNLMDKFNLLEADIAAVYPVRLDRGKQPEKIIRLLSGVKKSGYSVKLLIIDWQSAGSHFQTYIDELLSLANSLDVDLAFTSRLDDSCNQGVPRNVVTELMDLSNVYIHPSKVETYSLVVHEAILRGKLICLNYDFPVMHEMFGESAIYFDFESDRMSRTYTPDEQSFWNDEAKRLVAEFKKNRILVAQTKARKEWSPQAMWQQFEYLLYL